MRQYKGKPRGCRAVAALLGMTLLGMMFGGGVAYAGHPTTLPTFPPPDYCPKPWDEPTGLPPDPFCGPIVPPFYW